MVAGLLLIQKYGGTSVGSIERVHKVAERIVKTLENGNRVVVVVSAMAGETSRLMALSKEVWSARPTRETDVLLATGEQITVALLSMALTELGYPARSFSGQQAGIQTSNIHCQARIERLDPQPLLACLEKNVIPVIAGFQGIAKNGDTTTLGRGGSDTTAMAIAIALNADECQIYTDVDGVYTTDPNMTPKARVLKEITLEEMLELASLGTKVLHPRAVGLASKHQIPLRVLSSFNDHPGTLIKHGSAHNQRKEAEMEQPQISGITATRDEAKLTLQQVSDQPGIASDILIVVSEQHIHVDMIVQNVADNGLTDFTFTVKRDDYEITRALLENLTKKMISKGVIGDDKVAKVSLVGVGMRSHTGVASKMFKILADATINIQMISTSEIKISVLIDEKYMDLAVQKLHQGFGLDKEDIAIT